MNGKSFKIEKFVGTSYRELRLIINARPVKLALLLEQIRLSKYGLQTRIAKVSH